VTYDKYGSEEDEYQARADAYYERKDSHRMEVIDLLVRHRKILALIILFIVIGAVFENT